MAIDGGLRGARLKAARQPRSVAGESAIADLATLGESVRQADERALQLLKMRSIDALALSHLVQAEQNGDLLSPSHLARALKVSSAAITKLVDRLVEAGRIERRPNPRDRRGIVLAPVGSAIYDVSRAYGHIHTPVVEAIDELTDAEAEIVGRFAARLSAALQRAIVDE